MRGTIRTMTSTLDGERYIRSLARETLDKFQNIFNEASRALSESSGRTSTDVFVNPSPPRAATVALQRIHFEERQDLRNLRSEPAIARVVVDEDGDIRTWYICRSTPALGLKNLASYRTRIGRYASLPVDEEFELQGTTIVVREQARFRPSRDAEGWDSRRTLITAPEVDPVVWTASGAVEVKVVSVLLNR